MGQSFWRVARAEFWDGFDLLVASSEGRNVKGMEAPLIIPMGVPCITPYMTP